VVQIRSASKTWAVCGWRIGWVVADPDLARRVASSHVSLFGPAPGPPQDALEHLHDIDPSYHVEARATVQRRFDRVTEALESNSFRAPRPSGGFYLWLDIGHLMEVEGIPTATAWCEELARRTGVGLWPGDDFGGPRHARVAVTAPGDPTWEDDVAALAGALAAHGSGCNGGE
jgi:aminotransferase